MTKLDLIKQVTDEFNRAMGTPRNLEQAIANGLAEIVQRKAELEISACQMILENHIKDFLSQKFQLYMSGDGSLIDTTAQAIWEKITGVK